MKIYIWTKNRAKLKAIEDGISSCNYLEDVEIITESVESWVSDMPLSMNEIMYWAKNRAKNLAKKWLKWDFYVWIEWWVSKIDNKTFLYGFIYIEDNYWNWHFWSSPLIEVPIEISDRLYKKWEELWNIENEITWETDIPQKNWSFWLWTDDKITRSKAFELAFICAISPFFNKYYK